MNRKIIQTALALVVVSFLLTAPRAQQQTTATPAPEDRIALYQALLDLTNPWTVMCIAAHPDDEDGTSLIVMRRKYGAHTVSLFSTFGEGGQNAIGPELYEELGAIRARETMAAAAIQGSEPHFLGLKDFGYSKSADEAFKFWGHDEALRRMVLQIRKLRPDVIITNHNTTNGHGHHQATGRLELEAFDAAADPKRFPEQLKDGVTTWQVQRLFLRVGFGNQLPEQNGGTVTIDPNERDPIRDTVFAEEALRALQKHATQGPWPKTFADMLRFRNSQDGKLPLTRYVLVREAKGVAALPKDSHNFLDGLRLLENITKEVAPPTIDGRPLTEFIERRAQVLNVLILARANHIFTDPIVGRSLAAETEEMLARERRAQMLNRLDLALAAASRVSANLATASDGLVPGVTTSFDVEISNKGDDEVGAGLVELSSGRREQRVSLLATHIENSSISPGGTIRSVMKYETPLGTESTVPHSEHLYDSNFLGWPVTASASIGLKGAMFHVFARTFVDVVPAVEITNISPSPIVRTPAATKRTMTLAAECVYRDSDFNLRLTNHQGSPFSGELATGSSTGRKTISRKITIGPHESVNVAASVSGCLPWIDSKKDEVKAPTISFTLVGSGATEPVARLDVPVVWADARVVPNLRIGYVRGFDFSLPNALAALGVESKELSVDEVKTADLAKYSTIIVDNRVYESQPELIAANQRLLDYAKDGGTLIVFYHKSNEWNPDERRKRPQLAPYKLILGDERITDETAPITFIEPQHPLLNFPNKMGQEDFANWIQERGLYYPKDWDPQYHALLQSNDPGEAPLKGGLLVADYGRGHYIYTSMVWYRELRGGVPGAYRMLANMISYGQAEGKSKK